MIARVSRGYVIWKHEDPVTGSYSRKRADGSSPTGSESLPNAEVEPLGGRIPDEDPYDPTIPPPAGLRDFRYSGGDVFRPEYGCIVDGFLQDGPGLCTRMLENGSGRLNSNYDLLPAVASAFYIYPVTRAIGDNDAPTPPGSDPDSIYTSASYATTRYEYDYIFGGLKNNWLGDDASVPNGDDRVDTAIKDAKKIFEGDNECSRFFEQAFLVASEFEGQNSKLPQESYFMAQYDAGMVADALGPQLQNDIGLIPDKPNDTSIGIQMRNTASNLGTTVQSGSLNYRMFARAIVNVRGPFLSTGRFGNYSGRAGRALAVLHEIAHMIQTGKIRDSSGRIMGYAYLIPDDGKGGSPANTATIEAKCKKELDALKAATR